MYNIIMMCIEARIHTNASRVEPQRAKTPQFCTGALVFSSQDIDGAP